MRWPGAISDWLIAPSEAAHYARGQALSLQEADTAQGRAGLFVGRVEILNSVSVLFGCGVAPGALQVFRGIHAGGRGLLGQMYGNSVTVPEHAQLLQRLGLFRGGQG